VKKKRSKAQRAATRKLIARNKAARRTKKRGRKNPVAAEARKSRKSRRKNPIARAGTKAGARKAAKTRAAKKAKRSRAAKKAWRTRKHGSKAKKHAKKSAKKSTARKGGRSHASYVKVGKKAARTRKAGRKSSTKRKSGRTKASYKRAGRKAAAARRYKANSDEAAMTIYESRRRRKRRNPIAKEAPRRRRHKRNPVGFKAIKNPIPLEGGLDFFSGLFAVTIGYLFASGADRMGSTHALTASSSQGGYTDAPAVGQIYNSESTSLPIWSSGMRLAFNALAIAAPLGISAFVKTRGPKAFFQLMAFAAIARTVGKAADDGLSMALKSTSFGLRVYAPELAAASKSAQATTAALPAAAPGVFAGAKQPAAFNGALTTRQEAPPQSRYTPIASLPQPGFQGSARHVAGPSINSSPVTTGPAFNPWAATDGN
jgi:hypothetical protein